MMENRKIDLSLGFNANDFIFFDNGVGFLDNLNNKFNKEKSTPSNISLAGVDYSPTWLMELNDSSQIFKTSLEDTYSLNILDDILDGKPVSPGTNISNDQLVLDTPLASPISSSDESCADLDELLLSACPDEVLSSIVESSSVPLAEHMYASSIPVNEVFQDQSKAELSPVSDDSGFVSGEDSIDSSDLLMQFLNGGFDLTFEEDEQPVVQEVPEINQEIESSTSSQVVSTIDFSILDEISTETDNSVQPLTTYDVSSNDANRYSPYKKKKNPEQKLKKKSQNRKAASRYRSKKKIEMDTMLGEADELESKNKVLRDKVGGLKGEIDYLKNLMLDVIKARLSSGNISLNAALKNSSNSSS